MLNRNIYFILITFLFFIGCKSSKTTVTEKNSRYKRAAITEVSEKQLNLDAMLIDATMQAELGNKENAISLLNEILKIDSSYAPAYYYLGNQYFASRNINSAIDATKKAIALNPKNVWYQLQLASIYQQVSNFSDAAKIFQTISEQNPEILEYYDEWARCLLMANKAEDALKVYDRLEKRIGVSEEISMQKQRVYLSMNNPAKATLEIEKLAKAFPNETRYNAILAEVYMSSKNYDKALAYYQKVKETNPSDKYIDVSLANYYQKTGNPTKAYEHLKLGLKNPNLDETSKVQILLSFYPIKDFYGEYKNYTFELTQMLAQQYPNNATLGPVYGDFLFKNGQFNKALPVFKKAIEQDSSKYELWEALLYTELELGNDSLIMIDSKKALELFPMQPMPAYFYGLSLLNKKKYSEALSVFNQGEKWVIDNKRLSAEFFGLIGECHYQLKNYEKSEEFMKKALEINPDNYMLLNNYAYYLSVRKTNLDKAESMSRKTIEKFPTNPTFLDTYAWILFEKKQYNDALTYMQKALQYDNNASAIVLEHYADILYKTGQTEKAKEYWKKAIEKGDGSEFLKEKAATGTYIE